LESRRRCCFEYTPTRHTPLPGEASRWGRTLDFWRTCSVGSRRHRGTPNGLRAYAASPFRKPSWRPHQQSRLGLRWSLQTPVVGGPTRPATAGPAVAGRAPSCTIRPSQRCPRLTSLVMLSLVRRHFALRCARLRDFRNEKVRGSNPLSSTTEHLVRIEFAYQPMIFLPLGVRHRAPPRSRQTRCMRACADTKPLVSTNRLPRRTHTLLSRNEKSPRSNNRGRPQQNT
jgi:hypothetical protein